MSKLRGLLSATKYGIFLRFCTITVLPMFLYQNVFPLIGEKLVLDFSKKSTNRLRFRGSLEPAIALRSLDLNQNGKLWTLL